MLQQYLRMNKLSATWVPGLLTIDQKRDRVSYAKDGLLLVQGNPQYCSLLFVAVTKEQYHVHLIFRHWPYRKLSCCKNVRD